MSNWLVNSNPKGTHHEGTELWKTSNDQAPPYELHQWKNEQLKCFEKDFLTSKRR